MSRTPVVGPYLDDEENAIIEAIEREDYNPASLLTPELLKEHQAAARATLNEERIKISLRLRSSDLRRLKERALKEGMPYQTLIGSILHKAVSSGQ
jgi:predicted DNA binding CopG/RHH family protein